MKRVAILLVAVLATGYTNAQKLTESEVPVTVKQAFSQKFPNAKEVEWQKEDTTDIEVEFEIGKIEYSATFDQTGKWLETELEIKKSELPEAVRATILKEFSGFKIKETVKTETPDQGTLYEVELEKKEVSYDVQFSAAGKVSKKEVKESEDKKEKD